MAKGAGLSLTRVAEVLDATVLAGESALERVVTTVCCSDLMSDVLCFGRGAQLLVTGLATTQTVRTAEVSDIAAICLAYGKRPAQEVVQMAETTKIVLLSTRATLFGACAALSSAGLEASDA